MSSPLPIQSETHLINENDFKRSFNHYLEASQLNSEQDELVKKIFRKIEEGTSSTVYSFSYGGKTFAVKHYKEDYMAESKEKLQREKNVSLAVPAHPHLLKTYFTTDELSVMEFVPGSDLCNLLDNLPNDEKIAKKIVYKIAEGIQALHEKGIVHRDIKHDNILLGLENEVLKIADFGFARFLNTPDGNPPTQDDHTKERRLTCSGTPRYVAPEVIRSGSPETNLGEYGFPVDIWPLGVIAYELITKRDLFDVIENRTSALKHFEFLKSDDKVEIPKDLPPLWQDLLSRMLEKDPEKRITAQEILKHPLFTNN